MKLEVAFFLKKSQKKKNPTKNKQANKQTNQQTNKQTNKQTENKWTVYQQLNRYKQIHTKIKEHIQCKYNKVTENEK